MLDHEELKGLIDHMDYNILIRSDMIYDEILQSKEHSLYRIQIENRIGYSQYCLRLLYHALQMNIIEANVHFEETVKYMKECITHTGWILLVFYYINIYQIVLFYTGRR